MGEPIYTATTAATSNAGPLTVHFATTGLADLQRQLEDLRERTRELADGSRCTVCGRRGPGRTAAPNGQTVHRWPCRDLLL